MSKMRKSDIQALIVEDSEADFALLADTLSRQIPGVVSERVESDAQLRAALARRSWDLIISDHHLPGYSSTEALATLREFDAFVPFLIVSGTIGEEAAVRAMQAGADDYLIKGSLARLGAAIQRALSAAVTRRERDQAQLALADSKQQLEALSAHLQTSIEALRSSIAREIHDDIGSALTALRFDLDWLARLNDAAITERAAQAAQMLNQAQLACQRIMRNLRPPILEAGLVPALLWVCSQFRQRHDIRLELRFNRDPLVLPDEAALTVFRCVQEALTNIGKHSGAKHALIDIVQDDDDFSVEISDDGVGLDAAALNKPASFGLRGLRERARSVNGWLELPPTQKGCVLLLTLSTPADLR
jgi:two-component system, NarL family, sensor histidine kinase UhpB